MVGIVLFISLAFNVIMLIHIKDKEEEQLLYDEQNNELREELWFAQQCFRMLEEECNILRDDLHLEQQLREDAEAKNKQITLTVDAKTVTERVMKQINKKIEEIKREEFR